jgi:hypothetical protein
VLKVPLQAAHSGRPEGQVDFGMVLAKNRKTKSEESKIPKKYQFLQKIPKFPKNTKKGKVLVKPKNRIFIC